MTNEIEENKKNSEQIRYIFKKIYPNISNELLNSIEARIKSENRSNYNALMEHIENKYALKVDEVQKGYYIERDTNGTLKMSLLISRSEKKPINKYADL